MVLLGFGSLIVGFKLGDRLGLFIGFVLDLIFFYFLFAQAEGSLLKKLGAEELVGQDPWNLNDRVMEKAHAMGLKAPRLFLMEQETATAFSLGIPGSPTLVALSTGLLKKLTPEEVDAILVHQVCHIARMDTFGFGVASLLADTLLSYAEFFDQLWPLRRIKRFKNQRPFQFVLLPVAWMLIRLTVRQRNYFDNDDLAQQLVPDRKILARALWKLESLNQARPLDIPDCSSHLFVVNPRGLQNIHWFYQTHPKMSVRLKRMMGTEVY